MKILHIGCCATGEPYHGLSLELSKLGEYREISSGHFNLEDEIIEKTYDFKPDIVFCQVQKEGVISPYSIKYLKSIGAYVFNWTGDVRTPIPEWYFNTGVDCTLFSSMHDVRIFNKAGLPSDYLQIGFDPLIYKPEGIKKPCEEIVFFGTNYNDMFPLSDYRYRLVNKLKEEFGSKFGVYGGGWDEPNGNLNRSQEEEAEHLRSVKIAINVSHFEYERYSSDRIHRIMGTGAMCLSHWWPYQELDYTIKEHLDVFHGIDEAIQKCYDYLSDDKKRKTIASNGCKHAHENFTYKSMIDNLIKIYNDRK